MSLPTSLHAYPQEIEAFEKAGLAEFGVRFPFDLEGDARSFLARLHQCRTLQRRDNSLIYQPGDPLYGHCEWDLFKCFVRTDGERWWTYIRKIGGLTTQYEELTEETLNLPAPEPKQAVLLPPVKAYRR